MIKFKGELSPESRKCLLDRENRVACVCSIIVIIPFTAIVISLAVSVDLIFLLFIGVFILIIVMARLIKPGKDMYGKIFPHTIEILPDDDLFICEGDDLYKERKISDVKTVTDHGTFYRIHFYFPNLAPSYLCQKDLLVQGTIEEFEKLFKGKIVRKNKVNS